MWARRCRGPGMAARALPRSLMSHVALRAAANTPLAHCYTVGGVLGVATGCWLVATGCWWAAVLWVEDCAQRTAPRMSSLCLSAFTLLLFLIRYATEPRPCAPSSASWCSAALSSLGHGLRPIERGGRIRPTEPFCRLRTGFHAAQCSCRGVERGSLGGVQRERASYNICVLHARCER